MSFSSQRHAINMHADAGKQQRKRGDAIKPSAAITGDASNHALSHALRGGTPLDPGVRAEMEARFGESFSDVRVHNDAQAHQDAATLDAKAYTVGTDITFSAERYAPHAADGKRLLAHELAHVVQQRRGGATPALSPTAQHEASADQAAGQVAAGASSVQVGGGTGVGVARDVEEDQQKKSSAPLPREDASRVLDSRPQYWLSHAPDFDSRSALQLHDEGRQIQEYLLRQIEATPEVLRLEKVRDQFYAAADARDARADLRPQKKQQRLPDDASAPAKPRMLREHSSIATDKPGRVTKEYDEIVAYLQNDNIPPGERKLLQTELMNLKPAAAQYLMQRSNERHAEVVSKALDARDANGEQVLPETMRRIDSIKPLEGKPGSYYLMSGRERIVISEAMLDTIHAQALRTMDVLASDVPDANKEVRNDYDDFFKRTFDDQPYVGFISMARSWENPSSWEDTLQLNFDASDLQLYRFRARRKDSKDPWRTSRAELAPMAENLDRAEGFSQGARNYLNYKKGLVFEGTIGAINYLSRLKAAGNLAASVAFSPWGSALYSALESTLEQGSEIIYDQRQGFDFVGIGFDAFSSYAGSKVTNGVLSLAKGAPAIVRLAAFVAADRAGAGTSTAVRMTLDKARGRDISTDQILHAAWAESTDWKQAALNLAMVGVAHLVHTSSKPKWMGKKSSAAPKQNESFEEPKAASEDAARPAIEVLPDAIPIKEDQRPTTVPAEPKGQQADGEAAPKQAHEDATSKPPVVGSTLETRLKQLEQIRLPAKLAKPIGKIIEQIRQRAGEDPVAAQRLLTALEEHLQDANVTLPGEKIDPQTQDMLGGKRDSADESRAHPDEVKDLSAVRSDDRFSWSESEEESSTLQAEFPELPAAGWLEKPRIIRRPGGNVEILPKGPGNGRTPRGSSIPEFYHPGTGEQPPVSVEVKNWMLDDEITAEDPFRRMDFLANVANQARRRANNLPENARQYVIIDVRGQRVSPETQQSIRGDLVKYSNGVLQADRIRFLTSSAD